MGLITLLGLGCGGSDGVGPSGPGAPVAPVEVTPSPAGVPVGRALQPMVTTRAADGRVLTPRSVVWISSDAAVAAVNGTGMVTGVSVGTALVMARSETVADTVTVTVSPAAGGERLRTWTGASAPVPGGADWSAPGNWDPVGAPAPGGTVVVVSRANAAALTAPATIAGGVIRGARCRSGVRRRTSNSGERGELHDVDLAPLGGVPVRRRTRDRGRG